MSGHGDRGTPSLLHESLPLTWNQPPTRLWDLEKIRGKYKRPADEA